MRIGIFDSGFGGLTVFKEVVTALPQYDYLYFGDNARAPYGARSLEVIYRFTLQVVEYLFKKKCTIVIIACNTSSARALRSLQQIYLVNSKYAKTHRILGVVRPSAEALAGIAVGDISSKGHPQIRGNVGILGTNETIRSQSYILELTKLAPNLRIYQQACPMLAPLVEAGELEGMGTEWFVKQYIDQLLSQSAQLDRVLLACTHYPALLKTIQSFLPADVPVLSQAPILAERFANWLERHPEFENKLTKTSTQEFISSDDARLFNAVGERILGRPIQCTQELID